MDTRKPNHFLGAYDRSVCDIFRSSTQVKLIMQPVFNSFLMIVITSAVLGCTQLDRSDGPREAAELRVKHIEEGNVDHFDHNIQLQYVSLYVHEHQYPTPSTGIGFLDRESILDVLRRPLPHPAKVDEEASVLGILGEISEKTVILPEFHDEVLRQISYKEFYTDYYIEPAFPGESVREFNLQF